jgi:CheY-like chemotaxis protein
MNARGLNFFENWINENIREPGQSGDWAKARELAQKLIADAAAVGFTVEDLAHDERSVEQYIHDHMTRRVNRPMRRIVIIDDVPALAETLSRMLSSLGHQVMVWTDASSRHTFDLEDDDIIFVDVMMPRISGFQVLEQLARQKSKSWIVLMSGDMASLNEAEKLAEQLERKLIGALAKPFRLADIKDVLAGK